MNKTKVCLIINIELRTRRVMQIGLSPTSLVIPAEDRLNLVGEVAEWLYVALTGHSYDDIPYNAAFFKANGARAYIQARQHTKAAWRIAQEVVNQWGEHIQPWLGCLIQADDGTIIQDAPEYTVLFSLATGREIPPVMQGWLWVSER